jgi:hypothetical protein
MLQFVSHVSQRKTGVGLIHSSQHVGVYLYLAGWKEILPAGPSPALFRGRVSEDTRSDTR